jgi:transposase
VERIIPPVVGRKNYLFAGSHQAAQRVAMIYSLLGTCKLNDVNPYAWLKDVFDKLNSWPINRIQELLPHNWKKTALTLHHNSLIKSLIIQNGDIPMTGYFGYLRF